MPVSDDTIARRRHLPRLEERGKTYYVTFSTINRRTLPPQARTIALHCCVHDHQLTYWLHVAVAVADHIHVVFTPYEEWCLSEIMKRVKGNSSRQINILIGRRGALWQDESFDRITRQSEDLRKNASTSRRIAFTRDFAISRTNTRGSGVNGSTEKRNEDRQDCLSSTYTATGCPPAPISCLSTNGRIPPLW
jgi:REP element-mobilizing transposase RayT